MLTIMYVCTIHCLSECLSDSHAFMCSSYFVFWNVNTDAVFYVYDEQFYTADGYVKNISQSEKIIFTGKLHRKLKH